MSRSFCREIPCTTRHWPVNQIWFFLTQRPPIRTSAKQRPKTLGETEGFLKRARGVANASAAKAGGGFVPRRARTCPRLQLGYHDVRKAHPASLVRGSAELAARCAAAECSRQGMGPSMGSTGSTCSIRSGIGSSRVAGTTAGRSGIARGRYATYFVPDSIDSLRQAAEPGWRCQPRRVLDGLRQAFIPSVARPPD